MTVKYSVSVRSRCPSGDRYLPGRSRESLVNGFKTGSYPPPRLLSVSSSSSSCLTLGRGLSHFNGNEDGVLPNTARQPAARRTATDTNKFGNHQRPCWSSFT